MTAIRAISLALVTAALCVPSGTPAAAQRHALAMVLAVPPPPSGKPLPPGAVEILDPIANAVARYDRCITDGFRKKHPVGIDDANLHRREMAKAIAACAEVRRSAVAEAERELAKASDYSDPTKRDLAIRHAFEGTEEMRREFRAHVVAGVYDVPKLSPAPTVVVPVGTMPAVMQYVACMTAGMNVALRERIAARQAREARASEIDSTCRAEAMKALPRITSGRIIKLDEPNRAALYKAMDQLAATDREMFVDPDGFFRRRQLVPAKDETKGAPRSDDAQN